MTVSYPQFIKNLILFAPNKGEAKKTVSQGYVRLGITVISPSEIGISGLATDDFTSIYTQISMSLDDAKKMMAESLLSDALYEDFVGYWLPETLKADRLIAPDLGYDKEFDQKFWVEHVYDSIVGTAQALFAQGVQFNPERLRKLGLLEPRGSAIEWTFAEWADRSIIRWHNNEAQGVYAPIGMW